MTLREAGERYLGHIESRRGLKRATLQDYWLYLRRHLAGPQSPVKQGTRPVKSAPFFEDTQLASITRPDVNRYIDQKIEEGLTPRTLDSHLTFLSAVFRYANEQSWVERNPLSASSARDLMLRTTWRTAHATRIRSKKVPPSCARATSSSGRCSRRRTTPVCGSANCSP